MRWEYGSIVAVQTGRPHVPIRVARINGQLWNNGNIFDDDVNAAPPDDLLNQMGNEGWELVNVTVALDGWDMPPGPTRPCTLAEPLSITSNARVAESDLGM